MTGRDEKNRYLHLAAFVAHQYYRLQDNLVAVILTTMHGLQNRARRAHQEHCYAQREQRHASLKTLLGFFDMGVLETRATISEVTKNSALTDSEKLERICAILAANEAAKSRDRAKLTELKTTVLTEFDDDDYYEFLSA